MDLGQVFTENNVADFMVSLFTIDSKSPLLDPCFGEGVFLNSAIEAGYKNLCGYELDEELFNRFQEKKPLLKLINADFLQSSNNVKYDGIIMNPPYIRHEKIDNLRCYGITKESLSDNIFSDLPNTANLYMYFIIKAIDLLNDNGELIAIFPSSWLKSKSGYSFKNSMLKSCRIVRQIHLSGKVFKEDALVDVVILYLKKDNIQSEIIFENACLTNGRLIFEKLQLDSVDLGFNTRYSELASIRRGLTTGYNKMFINPPLNLKESNISIKSIISSPKSLVGYSTENAILDSVLLAKKDEFFSDEVSTYLEEMKKYIYAEKKPKTLYEKIERFDEGWYELNEMDCKGIIFSYFVRDKVRFIFNEQSLLVRDNFYVLKPKINSLIFFAVLNSFYTFYQLEVLGKKYGAGLLKLQKYDIENLYFPNVFEFTDLDLERLEALSKKLLSTSSPKYIDEISKVISNYSLINFSDIKELYSSKKSNRLGGKE